MECNRTMFAPGKSDTNAHAHIYLNCGDDRGESGDDGNSGIRKPHKLCISDFQLPEMGNL